jgi:uncharacterized Tic20 family protein
MQQELLLIQRLLVSCELQLFHLLMLLSNSRINNIIAIQIASLILLGTFILLTTCGVLSKGIPNAAANMLLVNFFWTVGLLILLTHIATTIYAAFRAQRGEVYAYPMAIKFLFPLGLSHLLHGVISILKGLAKEPDPGHNQLQIKVAQK